MARLNKLEKLIRELKEARKDNYDERFTIEGYKGIDLVAIAGYLAGSIVRTRNQPAIVIGRDLRSNAVTIADSFATGVLAKDVNVIDLGTTTTPNCEYVAQYLGLANAMVTASHMSKEEIGLKINLATSSNNTTDLKILKKNIPSNVVNCIDQIPLEGKHIYAADLATELLFERLSEIPNKDEKVRVCIDSANGVGSIFLNKILMKRGVEISKAIRDTPDGNFPTLMGYAPDPTKFENLQFLSKTVGETGSDLGFFLDGDGDRLVTLLGNGKALDAAYMAAIYASEYAKNSYYILDPMMEFVAPVLARLSVEPIISEKRGRPNIKQGIFNKKAEGGAENSYHFYDSKGIDCGIANILKMIEIYKNGIDTRLNQIANIMPFYSPELRVHFKEIDPLKEIDQIELYATKKGYTTKQCDGIKIDDGRSYLRIRTSSNEPGVVTLAFWNTQKNKEDAQRFFVDILGHTSDTFKKNITDSYNKEIAVREQYFINDSPNSRNIQDLFNEPTGGN